MLGSIAYNVVTIIALTALMLDYPRSSRVLSASAGLVYYFRHFGMALLSNLFDHLWLDGVLAAPPLVYMRPIASARR